MSDVEFLPPTLVYGCEKPEMRFRTHQGRQVFFCLSNSNLHLTDLDLSDGTYEMGSLLGALCDEHCRSQRSALAPCAAFAHSYQIGVERTGLADVTMHAVPQWEECGGVKKLLEIEMTEEERYLLMAYLDDHWTDEFRWRDCLVAQWNAHWWRVEDGWGKSSRAAMFDRMIWGTIRYPALIPQVWLNWLHAAPDDLLKTLDERASRVDFVAFARGKRHVVEVDGPSHYATYHPSTNLYSPDEKAYARNLKIERWLRSEDWQITRIGRHEVRQAIIEANPFGAYSLIGVLPFGKSTSIPSSCLRSSCAAPRSTDPSPRRSPWPTTTSRSSLEERSP